MTNPTARKYWWSFVDCTRKRRLLFVAILISSFLVSPTGVLICSSIIRSPTPPPYSGKSSDRMLLVPLVQPSVFQVMWTETAA